MEISLENLYIAVFLTKLGPTYISELVSPKDTGGRYYLRSSNGKLLNIPPCKSLSTLGDRSFYMAALNYGTIFPFLLEIYLQLMLSRRLLKLIYFRRRFPANLLFLFSLLRRICI